MSVDLRELAIDRGGADQANMRTRRRVLTRYVLPLLLILGFLSLVAWASRDFIFPPHPVTVVPVFSTTAETREEGTPLFKAAGWIEPRPTPVRVAALAAGVVEELLVVEDQQVLAGQPIAELFKDDAKLSADRARAEFELRQAELDAAKASLSAAETRYRQPVHLEAALADAEATLAKLETELTNLPFKLRRAEADHAAAKTEYEGNLAAKGVVAGVTVDVSKSKATAAHALSEELNDRHQSLKKEEVALIRQRDAHKTQLDLRADEIKSKDEAAAQVRAATARVDQARFVVAEATLQLERMTVRAPIDGRVFRLFAHPGARLGGGMTQMTGHDGSTVVTLYRPDMLQIRVDVRFEDIPQVGRDHPVEIGNPALSSPLIGKVLFVSSEADIQKNTLQVKVAIPDPPPVLKPEMLVDVTFLSHGEDGQRPASSHDRQETNRIFVPQRLIWRDGDAAFVWLADQSEKVARKQPIQTGSTRRDGRVEVTRGLKISSRVIVAGSDELTDGCRIRITGEDPTIGNIDAGNP